MRAVRGDGALGPSGGPGGVNDGGVVVGLYVGSGRPERGIGGGQVLVPLEAVAGEVAFMVKDKGPRPRPTLPGQPRLDALQPLAVDEKHARLTVVEGVRELVGGPPGIERNGDEARQLGGPEGDLPLGVVTHGDHGTVTGPQPVHVDEPTGERACLGEELPVAEPPTPGDQKGRVPEGPGRLDEIPQGPRPVGVLEPTALAPHDGEGGTGRGEQVDDGVG